MFEFDSLDDCIEIVHSKEIDPVEDLAAAVEDRNYPAAYSALRRLDGSLSGEKARDCLRGALYWFLRSCPCYAFRAACLFA